MTGRADRGEVTTLLSRFDRRTGLAVLAALAVLGSLAVYLVGAATTRDRPVAVSGTPVALRAVDQRNGTDDVVELTPGADPRPTGQRCNRAYSAGGTEVCLRLAGPGPTFEALVTTADGAQRSVPLPGVPSRARVSASGTIVSWTSFVTGDSYTVPGGFSTRSGVLDVRSGELLESLETFRAVMDGESYAATDVNYWGITVADDDRTFYATLGSANRTWLVRGDLRDRSVTTIGRDVECPSLSPDGTRIAFKQRVERLGPWELAVLDLASGTRSVVPGTVGVDDQAAWLDDRTLTYARAPSGALPSLYTAPADGSAEPTLVAEGLSSPVPLR